MSSIESTVLVSMSVPNFPNASFGVSSLKMQHPFNVVNIAIYTFVSSSHSFRNRLFSICDRVLFIIFRNRRLKDEWRTFCAISELFRPIFTTSAACCRSSRCKLFESYKYLRENSYFCVSIQLCIKPWELSEMMNQFDFRDRLSWIPTGWFNITCVDVAEINCVSSCVADFRSGLSVCCFIHVW